MKKKLFIALLIGFSTNNNFGIFGTSNLYQSFINSGHNAIGNLQSLTSNIIERLQDSTNAKFIALGVISIVTTCYVVKNFNFHKKAEEPLPPAEEPLPPAEEVLYLEEEQVDEALPSEQKQIEEALFSEQDFLQQFAEALESNNQEVIKQIIDKVGINYKNETGKSFLHVALSGSNLEITKLLLEYNNINIESLDSLGNTPLYIATILGPEFMNLLIQKGADINYSDKENGGDTPMHSVCSRAEKGKINKKALIMLAQNDKVLIDEPNYFGNTALHEAIRIGDINAIEILINNKANINSKNLNGNSPLHYAILHFYAKSFTLVYTKIKNQVSRELRFLPREKYCLDYLKIIRLLIKNRANLNLKNNNQETPRDLSVILLKKHPSKHSNDMMTPVAVINQSL